MRNLENLKSYYNQRDSYKNIYENGKIDKFEEYQETIIADLTEIRNIISHSSDFKGKLVDIACGPGPWLKYYHENFSSITLLDFADKRLDEAKKEVKRLNIEKKCRVCSENFFTHGFTYNNEYDWAFLSFFMSHLDHEDEKELFKRLTEIGVKNLVIIDSIYSPPVAEKIGPKEGWKARKTEDNCECKIYKRYFEKSDFYFWSTKYQMDIEIKFFGTFFFMLYGSCKQEN